MQVPQRIAVLVFAGVAASGCVTYTPDGNIAPPRIALVGDSWPLIMRFHGGFKQALVEEGYRPRQVRNIAVGWSYLGLTERRLAFQGIEAHRYVSEWQLEKLHRILARYPTIEIIHLSLGGADLLHDMPPRLTPAEQEAFLRNNVMPHIDFVLAELVAAHPDKLIAFVGYDYVNFRDFRAEHKRTQQRWEDLGQPEPVDLNEMSWRLNQLQQEVVAKHSGVLFIDTLGLTKGRLAADSSFWEPSPRLGLWKDGMHLSREGNAELARLCLDSAYRDRLMPLTDSRGRLIRPTGARATENRVQPSD